MKSIAIPSEDSYFKNFIYRTHDFITRMRWRAFFNNQKKRKRRKAAETSNSSNEENDSENQNTESASKFGFRTSRNPPYIRELAEFVKDVWLMVESKN